jgi:thioesterase domain-containing protein
VNVQELLEDLHKRDIQVWAEGDRLRCSAAFGMLTPELRERLKEHKREILEFVSAAAVAQQQRAVVPLQPRGGRTPVFAVAGHNGDVFCYRTLVQHLGDDQPFFALQPPGLDSQSEPVSCVEDLAQYFADQIWMSHSGGPYIIAGYCAGGSIAFELARELQERGGRVRFVAMFGCPYPTFYRFLVPRAWARRVVRHTRDFAALSSLEERRRYLEAKAQVLLNVVRASKASQELDPVASMRSRVERATVTAASRYTPSRFAGRLQLFLPNKQWGRWPNSSNMHMNRGLLFRLSFRPCGLDAHGRDTFVDLAEGTRWQ